MELLIGGVRSGKSSFAVRLASSWGRPVVFVATGEPGDDEMAARIERHRAERPAEWTTLEEPRELEAALRSVPPGAGTVLDCLTLWVANLMDLDDGAILARARSAAEAAAALSECVVITNEVGSGIHPANAMARRYADLLGWVNAIWADAADRVRLVVAGRGLDLERLP